MNTGLFYRFKTYSLLKYVSDLHLERKIKRNIIADKPYLLLAGDIGYPCDNTYKDFLCEMSYKFDKVFIVAGNHEFDKLNDKNDISPVINTINEICESKNNLFFLHQKTHVLCKENNIHIAGCTLWSELPKSKHKYHLSDKKWLYNTIYNNPNNNYVVATHHSPSNKCIQKVFSNFAPKYFASEQTDILKLSNMFLWIHGHTHINKNIIVNQKHIVSNQYGYAKNPLNNYKN